MPRINEADIRRAGLLVVIAAAAALTWLLPLPAAEANKRVVLLALHAVLLLGCAAVQLAPAHRAVGDLLRRALPRADAGLRWLGFALCLYAAGDVGVRKAAAAADDNAKSSLVLFLMFLAAVWAVYLSMVTGTGKPAAEEELDGGDADDDMAPFSAAPLVDSKV
ncbi:hypothetical protein BS78_06G230600 [Paspalum vaginatum]|nr:hypothetical protein BS78_06G230600 [Paspalum vaginatum]